MSTSTWEAETEGWIAADESPFATGEGGGGSWYEDEDEGPGAGGAAGAAGWESPWREPGSSAEAEGGSEAGSEGEAEWFEPEEPAWAGEGPGKGPAKPPLVKAGSSGAAVREAQQLLNRFLADTAEGFRDCVDRSPQRTTYMAELRRRLRASRQDPLVVDGRFGRNTEMATKLFQACFGLVRDGKVGPVTWHYLRRYAPSKPVNPPDTAGCGVPDRPSTELEHELDEELRFLHQAPARRRVAVRARLSLFQSSSTTSHRNHFQCQASRIARMTSAYADPRTDRCDQRRVGPTAYDTGADIISSISAAHTCLGQRLTAIHIVGHSGSHGVFGTAADGAVGLYVSTDATSRAAGARTIADVPAAALADDVVVVLHGCNQASGTDSFAEQLYRHLAATLRSPTVFAHPNAGCGGRDNSWRRFNAASPTGRAVRSIAPHYSGSGCCTPARGEAFGDEAEWEDEDLFEEERVGRRPCGCGG